jgi:tRNA 2-thiouridine synthesizing protein A
MSEYTLDVKGLNCPLPILKARKMLKTLSYGDLLTIETTDPGSAKDFESFCVQTGNELVSSNEINSVFVFEIKRL